MFAKVLAALLGVVAAPCASLAADSHGDQAAVIDALRSRIGELETEVARMLTTESKNWLTEARAAEVRAIVQDVLADADTRASLMQDGLAASYNDGFFIGSADGNFNLKLNGLMQFRYIYNHQDNGSEDTNRWGFENARTKLIFSGNVVSPHWLYKIEANFDRDGGEFGLEDAYIGHVFADSGWVGIAGQFKVPMLREELVYSGLQQTVERSLVNEEFTAGRTQGVAAWYRGEQFDFIAGYTDGHPATGGFNMPWSIADTEYAFTARGQVLFSGDWKQFEDMPSFRGDEFGMMLGGAVHYQMSEYGTPSDEIEVVQWTIDASVEFGGGNLFGYFVGRHLDATGLSLDQFGFVVQGGYFLTDDWEVFARYEWGDADLSGEDLSVITVGATRYFASHQLKWTTDIGFGIDEVSPVWADGFLGSGGDIAGWRTDAPGDDSQIVLRSQLQLMF